MCSFYNPEAINNRVFKSFIQNGLFLLLPVTFLPVCFSICPPELITALSMAQKFHFSPASTILQEANIYRHISYYCGKMREEVS